MGREIASAVATEDDLRIASVWDTPESVDGMLGEGKDYAAATGYGRNPVARRPSDLPILSWTSRLPRPSKMSCAPVKILESPW